MCHEPLLVRDKNIFLVSLSPLSTSLSLSISPSLLFLLGVYYKRVGSICHDPLPVQNKNIFLVSLSLLLSISLSLFFVFGV